MTLLRVLAYGSAVSTYVLILIGGYVTFSGSGLACPDWPLCHGQIVPPLYGPVLIEYSHRLFTLVVSTFISATTLLAWIRYRRAKGILAFATASFILLVAQILLGMVTVRTELNPIFSTAHLGLAAGLFGVVLLTAVRVHNMPSRAQPH